MPRNLLAATVGALAILSAAPALAAPPPMSQSALEMAAANPAVRAFYQRTNWRAAWEPQDERALRAALADADRHAIDGKVYLRKLDAASSPAAREAALTEAALSYGHALAFGLVNPESLFGLYTIDRSAGDLQGGLAAALAKNNVGDWIASLAPRDAEYRALSRAYVEAVARSGGAAPAPIPAGGLIRPGVSDPRVPAIAEALARRGYEGETNGTVWTKSLADALSRFQSDSGIAPDGIVGPHALGALNADASDRARQLAVNLERRRWLSRNPGQRRVDVNIAASFLEYWRGGEIVDRRRVVNGKPDTPTPQLGSTMTRLVVNPPWNVPSKIARNEILPKGRGYLSSHNMYIQDGRVVQRPGPNSALGLVKFDLDNHYAIYLHDTPSKSFFESAERHRSHGCVRVQDALGFARMLAGEDGKSEEFEADLASGKTSTVNIGNIPVRLLYHTAYLDASGAVAFAPDDYGLDDKVATALGMGEGMRASPKVAAGDVGP
ncbi:MAG TPA: L,D-transpeptidase family protein [Caulobacteraceae bacterium]